MAPLPNSGNPISMQMIFDEFGPYRTNGNGFEIDDYTGTTYWMNDFPYSSGKFTTTKNNLTLADFYGKRATDPVVPGLQRINASTVFTVPPYRNLLNIRVWGGGGGGGSASYKGGEALGTSGSSSSATVRHLGATTVLTSQGGVRGRQASRGGTIAGGAGGASNMTTTPSNRSPNPSREGDSNSSNNGRPNVDVGGSICTNGGNGGNAEGVILAGGEGGVGGVGIFNRGAANASAGERPGGGGGGAGYCFNKGKVSAGGSGGGSGGFVSQNFATNKARLGLTNSYEGLVAGQKITVVIGAGGNGANGDANGGNGGAGQVIINWT
jgi:hypothetical protein